MNSLFSEENPILIVATQSMDQEIMLQSVTLQGTAQILNKEARQVFLNCVIEMQKKFVFTHQFSLWSLKA